MSAFVLQNDGNRRGERWLSRPPQLHKRDTTISCKSRALDFLNSYELDWEHDKSRRNKLYVSRATDAVSNGELRFSVRFISERGACRYKRIKRVATIREIKSDLLSRVYVYLCTNRFWKPRRAWGIAIAYSCARKSDRLGHVMDSREKDAGH